jgi:general secretion pathway protein D
LDIRKAQVFVEAEILDVSTDGEFRFGTSIFGGYANADGKGTKYITAWQAEKVGPFITAGAYTDQGNQLSAAEGVAGAFEQDLSIGILSGESITVPGLGSVSPGALIKMLKGDSNTKILSSPHVLTANNEEAEVTVGQKIFFPSSEFNAATQTSSPKVENVDVDLTLSLKPNISFSNYVTLNIQLQANSLSGDSSVPGLPAVTKRMTKQIVTARNGQTIVISGLVQTRDIQAYQKIPFLGDIPILGWLFRNTSVRSAKSNLIIFLTPHVIHGPNDLAAIYKAKVEDQNEFLKSVYGEEGINDDFYKRLPTLSDGSYRADERDSADDQAREALRQQALKDMGYIKDEKEDQKSGSGAKTRDFEISVPAPQGGMAPQDWPSSESLIDEGGMGGMQDQNDSLIDESPPVLNGGDLGDPMPESFDGEGSMGEVL